MSTAEVKPSQPRDDQTGRFAFAGDMDRVCVCGHRLGVHTHGGFDCLAGTGVLDDPIPKHGEPCGCWKFRLSRRRKP